MPGTAPAILRFSDRSPEGDAGPASDVDFLVDMESTRTLLDLVGLQQDLEDMLGRRVDVVTEGGLSPYLREQILSQAVSL